jgi:hypothetical protein
MRRRQPNDTYGSDGEWQAWPEEMLDEDEQVSLADTRVVSGAPSPGDATDEEEGSAPATPRKRTLLTQALLIRESPQKPVTTATGESPALLIRGAAKPPRPPRQAGSRRFIPRGVITQVVVTITVVALLLGGITTATPLGRNIAGVAGFDAYANAIPWIPTPTPTPKPKPKPFVPNFGNDPGKQAVANEIAAVFGSYSASAIRVATCESGLNPNAYNSVSIGGSHAEGVFQILYPSTWSTTSYHSQSPYNYSANIRAAYEIFKRDGYSWREWSCGYTA